MATWCRTRYNLDAALKQGIFNSQFVDDAISIDEHKISLKIEKISLEMKNALRKCHVHVRQLKTSGDIEPPIFRLVRSFLHSLKAIKEVHIFWVCFLEAENEKTLKAFAEELVGKVRNMRTLENVEVILSQGGEFHPVRWQKAVMNRERHYSED